MQPLWEKNQWENYQDQFTQSTKRPETPNDIMNIRLVESQLKALLIDEKDLKPLRITEKFIDENPILVSQIISDAAIMSKNTNFERPIKECVIELLKTIENVE